MITYRLDDLAAALWASRARGRDGSSSGWVPPRSVGLTRAGERCLPLCRRIASPSGPHARGGETMMMMVTV